jgi:Holliday junction resolvase RusA-like endonuclease
VVRTHTFNVPGRAHGKARPRVNTLSGHWYSPDAGDYEKRVNEYALISGLQPVDGPVTLAIHISRKMPVSWSKKKKDRMRGQMVAVKPDGVNISAAIHDGLTGRAYHDDAQVSDQSTVRRWASEDNTRVTISWGFLEEL